MAKFVLAGKADCPHYAKAELLADTLQVSLPKFRIHKTPILPDEWQEWLDKTCKENGWTHEKSPLIWRELVDQGGKGMFIGGFSDFMEHCQAYYNITSDMTTEMMLRIGEENVEATISKIEEEKERIAAIKPLHIWISGALSPICNFLIPNLLADEVFPGVATISLHLLDLGGDMEGLKGLKMEVEDLALPLLHLVTIQTDVDKAFMDADVIILLDESWPDNTDPEKEEEDMDISINTFSQRYVEFAQLLDLWAHKDVKVIVCGDLYVNFRCSVLVDNISSIAKNQFVALATQLESQARAIMAKQLGVLSSDVTDIIVWGNISGSCYFDLQRAMVFNFDGPIKGPGFFSQPILSIFHDRKWLETGFQDVVRHQRPAMASTTCEGPATYAPMSAANSILNIIKAWNGLCSPDQIFSLGVPCSDGHTLPGGPTLPDGIVFSLPVTFKDGKWSILPDVTITKELKDKIKLAVKEIVEEKKLESEEQGQQVG